MTLNTPNPPSHSLLKLHAAVFVAGMTGLFGKLLSLSEIPLVWYRLLFTLLLFVPILHFRHQLKRISKGDAAKMAAVGALLGIHWILFYASIRLSNVSVGVVCYAMVGFYTAIFDPIINHRRFAPRELLFSLLTLIGLLLIFHFDTQFRTGILVGAISSAFAALFTVCNKRLRTSMSHKTTTFLLHEMIGGWTCLTLLLPLYMLMYGVETSQLVPSTSDLLWLLVLASVCTVGQYLLQLEALRGVSSFTVNLTYNLEPVYSIILAIVFLGESSELTPAFWCGISLIVVSVFLQNYTSKG